MPVPPFSLRNGLSAGTHSAIMRTMPHPAYATIFIAFAVSAASAGTVAVPIVPEASFVDIGKFPRRIDRPITRFADKTVAAGEVSSAFQSNLVFLTFSITESLDFMAVYHPTEEECAENIRKAHRPGLFFIYEEPLRLLDEDGYFANDQPPIQ